MVPPTGDGGSPAPIDRPILEFLQTRLQATGQVATALITDAGGHLELRVTLTPSYYPDSVEEATLAVRWYTNDDFKIHYREVQSDRSWECRWDRHPTPTIPETISTLHPLPPPPATALRGRPTIATCFGSSSTKLKTG